MDLDCKQMYLSINMKYQEDSLFITILPVLKLGAGFWLNEKSRIRSPLYGMKLVLKGHNLFINSKSWVFKARVMSSYPISSYLRILTLKVYKLICSAFSPTTPITYDSFSIILFSFFFPPFDREKKRRGRRTTRVD